MSNPNQITVKTNVRKLGDDESLVQDSFLFCQSTVDSTRAIKGHYTCYLTSKEERIVHKTVLDHLLGGFNEISLKHPSKDTTIIEPPLNYDVDTTDTQHDILVTIYEGAGKPPALSNGMSHKATSANTLESSESEVILPLGLIEHTSDFIRSWSPIDAGSPLHRRWIKIEIVVSPGGDWSQITKSLNHDDGEANHGRVMYVPIKVIRRFISRHQITQCGNDAATNFEISKATNIPLSSIEKVAGLNLGKTEYHRYYAEDTFAGTNLVTGSQRRYRTGTGDSLYFVEKPWAALMFASKPYTLAEVVIERHPHQVDFLRTHDGVSMLSKEFRGVKVSVRVGKQSETRTITAFRESRVGDAPIMLRHYAWAMKGDIVTLADLPCVDVGTLAKPLLLPLELCSIQPMQRLRGPVEAPLSRAAEHYRLSKQTRADDVETTQAHIAVHAPMSALRRGEHVDQKVVQACGLVFPNLLYVEAGSAKIGSRNWVALQTSLRDLIKKSFDTSVSQRYIAQPPTVPTSKDPLLRLQYDSDDNLSSRWAEQLRLFEKDHRGDANQRTFMIVCLPAERDHAKMYEVIKKACDLTTDIQTFFINFSALECRVREDPISGISRIAGDIRRRMRLRNPPSLADAVASRPKGNGAEDEFLTIAMHVSRVTTPTRDCIDPSHATEVYLCALVAANPKTGTCYNTELKLCTKADLDNVEMHVRLMFEPLVGELSFKDWRRVIILRSGYFPQRQPWLEISAASAGQSRPVFTRPDTRTDEFTSICTIFDRKSRPRNITYITLQEDKVLKLRIEPGDIKPAVSGQTELPALLLTKNTGNLGTELQSIRVTNVHSKDDSTGVIIASIINPPTTVTRIGTRNELWAAASSSFPTVKGKSLQPGTTTFGRGGSTGFRGSPARGSIPWDSPGTAGRATPLHDDTPTKSSRRGDTPSTPVTRAPSTVDEGNAETTTELGDAAAELGPQLDSLDLDDTKKKPENALTQAEVEMMVELWDGRDVGLVGTKWPVLTHLAHLATKRALLHLDRTDWEGTTGEGDTTPLFLPPVHKNVRNSLYYL